MVNIRYANKDDIKLLTNIGYKTFNETFAKYNSADNMSLYLAKSFSIEQQTIEINDTSNIFLIAEIDNKAVGYVKLRVNNSYEGVKGTNPIEIERIYSIQEYIGKGIGTELMKASIREARDRGYNSIWLGVWERNERAIKFYEKWGFAMVGSHQFMLGNDEQNDFIMELLLQ